MSLLEFYGQSCPHCIEMQPIVEAVESELGVEIEKFEVWNNDDNARMMEKHNTGLCGGVPFFHNTESKQFICGATDEATLKNWAEGKKMN